MEQNFARSTVELVQPIGGSHPEVAISILTTPRDVVGTQTQGIIGRMPIMGNLPRVWVEFVQSGAGCQPEQATAVLRNMNDCAPEIGQFVSFDLVMGEGLGTRVETVQHPIASDPQHAGAVFEQRINVSPGQAVHSTRLVHKYLEFVTVVAVDTVLRAEPDETAIVLDNLRDTSLR